MGFVSLYSVRGTCRWFDLGRLIHWCEPAKRRFSTHCARLQVSGLIKRDQLLKYTKVIASTRY